MNFLRKMVFINPPDPSAWSDPSSNPSFFSKTAWNAIASLANMVSRLLASVFVARSLGTDGTGQVAYFMWVGETAMTLLATGNIESLTRYLSEFSGKKKAPIGQGLTRWVFHRFLARTLGGTVLLAVFSGLWMTDRRDPVLLVAFSLMLATRLLSAFYQSYLTGLQRFDLLARLNAWSSLALILGVLAGAHWFGITGALAGYALGTLLPALLSLSALSQGGPVPDRPLRARFREYSTFIWFAGILGAFVWARMEVFFLHRYWNDHEVALFSVPQTVSALILNLSGMLSGAFLPHFASLWGSRDTARIHSVFGSGNRLLAFILFPTALGGAALVPFLLPLLYGHKFDEAIPNTMVLFAFSLFTFGNISTALISGLDRSRYMAYSGLLAAILSLIGGFTLIRFWGSWGAVWSRAVLQTGVVVAGLVYVSKVLRCPVPWGGLGRLGISASVCALAAGSVLHAWPTFPGMLAAILVGALVYWMGVRTIGGLERMDIDQLGRIVERFPPALEGPLSRLLRSLLPRNARSR